MPRDANGNHSLPLGPVQPDTTIAAGWANPTMDDLSAALTASLDRTGKGPMQAILKLDDQGMFFEQEQTTGLVRTGSGTWKLQTLGVDSLRLNGTGIDGPVTATGTTVPRNLSDRASEDTFNPRDFGDGALNSTNINLAIAAAKASSAVAKVIDLGPGVYSITSTVLVDADNILLRGQGKGGNFDGKQQVLDSAVTRFQASGLTVTDTMVRFTSNPNDDGTLPRKTGGGIVDVMIDGNEICGQGLLIQSWDNGIFDYHTVYCTRRGSFITTLANNTSGGPPDTQRCRFWITHRDTNSLNEPEACLVIGSGGSGNPSFNSFYEIDISAEKSARGLDFAGTDSNVIMRMIIGARTTPTGDGGKVFLHASDTVTGTGVPQNSHCRANTFVYVQAPEGFVAKNGTTPSEKNQILRFSRENGGPAPTIENGATLEFWEDYIFRPNTVRVRNDASGSDSRVEIMTRQGGVAVANRVLGRLDWIGDNDAAVETLFSSINARSSSITNGAENSDIRFRTIRGGTLADRVTIADGIAVGGATWLSGSGSPEGVVSAAVGSYYTNTLGGAGTTLYVKESGGSGNTGWVGK